MTWNGTRSKWWRTCRTVWGATPSASSTHPPNTYCGPVGAPLVLPHLSSSLSHAASCSYSLPRLIVAVTGGAARYHVPNHLSSVLGRGLRRIAEITDTWVRTLARGVRHAHAAPLPWPLSRFRA